MRGNYRKNQGQDHGDHRERRARCRSMVVALVSALLVTSALHAYTVVLKDGSTITATEKYVIQGDRAVITLPSGATTSLALAEIDIKRTDESNVKQYGTGAVVVDGRTISRHEIGTVPPQTLEQMLRQRRGLDSSRPPTTETLQIPKTAAGYEDLERLERHPLGSDALESELRATLGGAGLVDYQIHQGTRRDRVLLELRTENANAVFKALEVAAATFLETRQRHSDLQALEVLMLTGSRSRAGQFVLTAENAPLLVNGRLSPADFFLEYVEF